MDALFPFSVTTGSITVRASPQFQPAESDARKPRWFWTYHIRIENHGDAPVQLLRRAWTITDARGAEHLVEGDGVVGEVPVIEPGKAYDYVSGCPLTTPSGSMVGSYELCDAAGRLFRVAIPAFELKAVPALS